MRASTQRGGYNNAKALSIASRDHRISATAGFARSWARPPFDFAQGKLDHALPVACRLDDLNEAARVEAGPSDEGAVDVGLAH